MTLHAHWKRILKKMFSFAITLDLNEEHGEEYSPDVTLVRNLSLNLVR